MPKCPNCGRETLRTEDWACQWCGSPLLSGAFKKIPRTYREIQEEKSPGVRPVPEDRPEPEPQPQPLAELEEEPTPPPPEAVPEPEPETEIPPPPEPTAAVEAEVELEREPVPPSEPEPEVIEESEPPEAPEAAEAPAPEMTSEPALEPVTEPEPEEKVAPAPQLITAPTLEPDTATGIISVTVAGLNAAFNSDKAGTNNKLLNNPLRVTGTVDKVFLKDNLDIFYIILADAGNQTSRQVRCTFDRENSLPLTRLTDGQTATVQGTYVGYERNIILKDSSLVP